MVQMRLVAINIKALHWRCAKRTRADSQCHMVDRVKFFQRRVARRSVNGTTVRHAGQYDRLIHSGEYDRLIHSGQYDRLIHSEQ
ncbi:hypothetical protein TNCV_3742181 [Trichonephila clavipes]|nr:hypothetical protein TNCV_3742181 [Trichonephila clavipes]